MNSSNPIASVSEGLVDSFLADRLNVHVYENTMQLGMAAAKTIAARIRYLITERGRAIGIFSGDTSHAELLSQLVKAVDIEWTRVIGLHTAEILGADESSPQSQRKFLLDHLVRKVPMAEFHGIRGEAANSEAVCVNYSSLLKSRPPDFAVLGIDENGYWSLVDLPAADSVETTAAKIVELDDACRRRQVSNGRFAQLEEVPRRAITLTIQAIRNCPSLYVIVSGTVKQKITRELIEIITAKSSAASILQSHPNAHLFLTCESAG